MQLSYIRHLFNRELIEEVTVADIQKLIDDKTEESLHLDYEAIPESNVTFDGLAKHISGFLNTSGGIVIFGVGEATHGKHKVPSKITWTNLINKETVERSLSSKIEPWSDDIKLVSITNPLDATERVFLISAPKSKNPPHMANHKYYIRLNFEAQEMGHDQVAALFKQFYLQKYDLINSVYGPLYNELISYVDTDKIEEWRIVNFYQVRKDKMFLLIQDFDMLELLVDFYERVENWNKAVTVANHRIVKIANSAAAKFFKGIVSSQLISITQVYMDVKAETTHEIPTVYKALLNKKDPDQFWKSEHPYVRVLERHFGINYYNERNEAKQEKLSDGQFSKFMAYVKVEVEKDELIRYVRNERLILKDEVDGLLKELEKRM
jgi:hypothetical protein